jgi:hypothetical protein
MKKCKAFYPIAGTRTAWIPCVRNAEEGSRFCRRHTDAILGVMLGALVHEEPVNELAHLCSKKAPCLIEGGSRTRRGVPRLNRRARCISPDKRAGSDAGSGTTAGGDASPSDAAAAVHKTDADSAKPKAKKAGGTPNKKETKSKRNSKPKKGGGAPPLESLWDERAQLDGGVPLPEDGIGFVDAVNVNIDLIRLTELLLRGTDEKSSKSLLERLLEMRYGKNARMLMSETGPLVDSAPRAVRAKEEE